MRRGQGKQGVISLCCRVEVVELSVFVGGDVEAVAVGKKEES